MSKNETKENEMTKMTAAEALGAARETMAMMIENEFPIYTRQCQEELINTLKARIANTPIA